MWTKGILQSEKILLAVKSIGLNSTTSFTRTLITNNTVQTLSRANLSTKKDVDQYLKEYKEGQFDKIPDPSKLEHFKNARESSLESNESKPPTGTHTLPHPIWTEEQLHNVKITFKEPEGKVDKMAYFTVRTFRKGFDIFSGFIFGQRTEKKWLNRICFLETVAGVPGMVAAMTRHMKSLRRLQRDYGWIHTLLGKLIPLYCIFIIVLVVQLEEEAENERMHLLTAMELRQPSTFFRLSVIGAQGVFVTMFTGAYIVSPKFCHRFVGYLEEEAVKTYTKCLEDIECGSMQHWKKQQAPELAVRYWKLADDATMKDVILAIRADEAHHRTVNHTLAQ
ncbi:hypothetical protein LOTGIDRAFT_175466 [Lottia gigantea]|uniref:Alternative oxidase n=1 Tax=Lottia gigantea TaxID=225164 RepID=V4AC33_LOTGI|nr:hypothetical protein LOTGIDRAFT_175466 [Lottia gigantea]ESO94372.1 hypothetical protein LOTGIDRAFT_175466 [Lottia gigantea]